MVEPKYKRILIKLSGEARAGERGVGIDIKTVQKILIKQTENAYKLEVKCYTRSIKK